jgi:hypothetical protein
LADEQCRRTINPYVYDAAKVEKVERDARYREAQPGKLESEGDVSCMDTAATAKWYRWCRDRRDPENGIAVGPLELCHGDTDPTRSYHMLAVTMSSGGTKLGIRFEACKINTRKWRQIPLEHSTRRRVEAPDA